MKSTSDRRRPTRCQKNTAADLVERSVSETLTYYAFPDIVSGVLIPPFALPAIL
jgi:hypothetical protein